jgi:hypothetical protein
MSIRPLAIATVVTCLASVPALACTGKALLKEEFTTGRGWQKGEGAAIGAGKAVIAVDPQKVGFILYNGDVYDDIDMCVDVSVDKIKETGGVAGFVFWQSDWNNFALFLIQPNRVASIVRVVKGQRLVPVDWEKTELVDGKAGAVNKLRLTLKGGTQTAYINDKPFAELSIRPPSDPGKIGLWTESEQGGVNSWTFANLRITEPPR